MNMAVDPRKRQKKLERRKAKHKAERRELARRDARSLASRLEGAAAAPILHCCEADVIWSEGIGSVLVSRELNNGNVAFALFLVDIYCLGVKDVFTNIVPRATYNQKIYEKLAHQYTLTPLKPECARKLVEGAVRYADDLGLPPHEDYRTAKKIFGEIRVEDCTREYVFGKNGKPLFIAGPNDNRAKCEQILHLLRNHCGPGRYDFILGGPLSAGRLSADFMDLDEEDPDPPELGPPGIS
jgi:hypothetical protein